MCVSVQLSLQCLHRIAQTLFIFISNSIWLSTIICARSAREYIYGDVLDYFIVLPTLYLHTTHLLYSILSLVPSVYHFSSLLHVLSNPPSYKIATFLFLPIASFLLLSPSWCSGLGQGLRSTQGGTCVCMCERQRRTTQHKPTL